MLVMSVMGIALATAWSAWRYRLNPIVIALLAWTPAVVLTTIPYEFVLPLYDHLNKGVGLPAVVAMLMGFAGFSMGVLVTHAFYGHKPWDMIAARHSAITATDDRRLLQLFLVGLAIFSYAFSRSGLAFQLGLEPDEIFKSRLAFHLGPISSAVLFLDVTAIVFFAKLMENRRMVYVLPMLIAIAGYMITLQKSRVMFMGLSAVFLLLLYPAQARELVFGTMTRRLVTGLAVLTVIAGLFIMNAMRGIGLIPNTTFESPLVEQTFIYSGATAVLNLSAAVEGHVPSDAPTYGMVLTRPVLTHFIANRELLNPTKYFEGLNAATYLIYPWGDFRWFGFLLVPFLTGMLATIYLRAALRKTVMGLTLGSLAFTAAVFSVNTDVIFDQTTLVVMLMAFIAHSYAKVRPKRRKAKRAAPVNAEPSTS
ncbi:oligosaccharide repeat unit polymerase [Rhizobacter sp. J219]|uniref:O-antigen polymerase n=1 Tax=Rhizobacter sp. J219 TaxID=2898430 RepID=UPI00215108F1|nr:O-antigen polymerase [Rhizobacter sp. J219]MCR5885708.1 oligosaccharide repeat unit polymerase [Rhizobacter sp. J219]